MVRLADGADRRRCQRDKEGIAQYADHYLSEEHTNDRGMGCAIAALVSEVSKAKQVQRRLHRAI
jgi:hypothetical protein